MSRFLSNLVGDSSPLSTSSGLTIDSSNKLNLDFTKVQAKLSVTAPLSITNNVISMDTSTFQTKLTATAPLSIANNTITLSLSAPVNASDPATKNYVDSNLTTAGTGLTKTGTVMSLNQTQTLTGSLTIGSTTSAVTSPINLFGSGNLGMYYYPQGTSSWTWLVGTFNTNNDFCIWQHNTVGVKLTAQATAWSANSDERLKKKIRPFDSGSALDKVCSIQPVRYLYNTDSDDTKDRFGCIAQQVEPLIPEVITTDIDTGMKSMAYTDLIPFLISSIQELKKQVDALNSKE